MYRAVQGFPGERSSLPRRHLTGFRVQGVYSRAATRALTRPLTGLGLDRVPRLWATRQLAEDIAAAWRELPLAAYAEDWSFSTVVQIRRRWPNPVVVCALNAHSQCDLACDLCYFYRAGDQGWRNQPR